jgi:hypothetical protein
MGQMDLSKEILIVSQAEAVGPGVSGVVDPGISPGFIGKGVFLSFWHAKIIPSKKITRILFNFFWLKFVYAQQLNDRFVKRMIKQFDHYIHIS